MREEPVSNKNIDYQMADLLDEDEDEGLLHPLYSEYLRIRREDLQYLENIKGDPERYKESLLKLLPTAKGPSYRDQVKGFRMALDIHEPPKDKNELAKFELSKQAREMTSREIQAKLKASKFKKMEEKKLQEKEEKAKHERDRKELRKIHERLRQQKISQLLGESVLEQA